MKKIEDNIIDEQWFDTRLKLKVGVCTMSYKSGIAKEKYYHLTRKEFDFFCRNLDKRQEHIVSVGLLG